MNTWKVTYTAKNSNGTTSPGQVVHFPNFWRAASFVYRMRESGKLVAGPTKYSKVEV